MSAAVEQSRRKANMVAQGDGKFGPRGLPLGPSKPKKRSQFLFQFIAIGAMLVGLFISLVAL